MHILGISAYYHDSAAALIVDGEIVSAVQEERFPRQKHDAKFPKQAIAYCLKQAGINLSDIDQIVFYDKPLVKFERLLETYLDYAPRGFRSFITAMPIWLKEKLYLKTLLKKELATIAACKTSQLSPLLFTEHHQAHAALFGGPPRQAEGKITQKEMDLASSIQKVTEEVVLRLARTVKKELNADYLCLAGGVALNCVANGRILRETDFKDIWIQPAAGDAGGALGAALAIWHQYREKPRTQTINDAPKESRTLASHYAEGTLRDRLCPALSCRTGFANGDSAFLPLSPSKPSGLRDRMQGGYLGPSFNEVEILDYLKTVNACYQKLDDRELMPRLASILAQGNVVGWFSGRMEFGPRALGKKYWLIPLIVTLVILGGLIVFAQSSALAPFIYTLF